MQSLLVRKFSVLNVTQLAPVKRIIRDAEIVSVLLCPSFYPVLFVRQWNFVAVSNTGFYRTSVVQFNFHYFLE